MSAQAVSSLLASGSSCSSVPVEHLDYNFIQSCSDLKHLELILNVLRSGQEGFYPHLIDFCERHMEKLDPKNRFLWKEKPAATAACFSSEEWSDITEELQWETNVRMNEVKLNDSLMICDGDSVPAIRCSNTLQENTRSEVKKHKTASVPRAYRDWDRFDVEKECAKIDECDMNPPALITRPVPQDKHTRNSAACVVSSALREQEIDALACREKDKGNESFRSGDYEEAVVCYTRSLSLVPSAAAFNNRAQTHIRLQRWSAALSDCQAVLQLEPDNVKALLRRATVHKHLDHLKETPDDVLKEPHNTTAQKVLKEETAAETHHKEHRAGRKLFIQECDDPEIMTNTHNTESPDTDRSEESVQTDRRVGPAPGTTKVRPTELTHLKNEEHLLLGKKEDLERNTHTVSENTQAETRRRSPSKPRRSVPITEVEDEEGDEAQDSAVNRPSVSLQPSNAFEFGQVLNAACARGDLLTCADLLHNIPSERLPQYISTQLNGQTISFIIKTLNKHLRSHPQLLYEHLKHLQTTHRFSMVLMLLDSEDRSQLMDIFQNLSVVQTQAFSPNDVKSLANKYI
ncbi:sperm-associated antigen 1 isoform X3 [Triplophysa dalaica]|uniref:sperm-associated antigen 1 isoform X3 n=1 Tax=Triplophysa dalaica TaxID=1582913 RepID=UPI0024DFFC93|nr:sperm-associated antigen 1 isoform X3 [Triplophysa dalaica]